MTSIGEMIIDRLIAAGVKRVFGVPGDSLNGITDIIRQKKEIEWVGVRHEETAAFAAGAEAHLTGSLAVCAGSCGPGNLHLINGLYDCFRSRVPVLAIAAQIPSEQVGTSYFQETHPQKIFSSCTAYCQEISHPEQMPHVLEIAIQTALSLRTVSMIVISGDIVFQKAPAAKPRRGLRVMAPTICPSDADLEKAAESLNRAERVAILGGAGCVSAHAELMRVADKLKAPIVHTLRGKEYLEYDNPFDVGMTGLIGFSSGYHALMDCDTLLILGADFPYRQFLPEGAEVIQIDIRAENIGRRCHVDIGLAGDIKETLAKLEPKLDIKKDDRFLKAARNHYQKARAELDDLAKPGHQPIHPQYVAKLISDLAPADAIFTCDVGTPVIWAARYLKMNGKRRLLGSFSHGSMANAIPQAIGAKKTYPERAVITLSGDGGLSMLMGELLTLRQTKTPIKIVVFNNGVYGFVALEMKAIGILEFATDLVNPNFAKVAEAMEIMGIRVEDPKDLPGALKKAFEHDGPALVDVVINQQELSMPPKVEIKQAIGFNLWMLRAVMNGRGNELVQLVKTNLFR
jgi:pyruvate dehydrogenase (quinone)